MTSDIHRKEQVRFFRFLVVGAIGAGVDFLVMNILSHTLQMPLVVAGSMSFLCAVISNFIWNRYWTYSDSRSKPLIQQLGMFFLVNLAGVIIRLPILHFVEPAMLNSMTRMAFFQSLPVELIAKNGTLAIAITIVLLWNFFVNRYWTYNDIKSTTKDQFNS